MIWKNKPTLEQMNASNAGTIHESLGIVYTAVGDDYLEGTMPVDKRTHQPRGLLHGGASAVLAESLVSIASFLVVGQASAGQPQKSCVGLEINASHLRGIQSGIVLGRATAVRVGKTVHVWDVRITELADPKRVICIARLTVLVTAQ